MMIRFKRSPLPLIFVLLASGLSGLAQQCQTDIDCGPSGDVCRPGGFGGGGGGGSLVNKDLAGGDSGNQFLDLSTSGGNGQIIITAAETPEPATCALLGLPLLWMAALRRWRGGLPIR